eukprot:scaffold42082_cov21-Tisochrysis_lutea.AAC.1
MLGILEKCLPAKRVVAPHPCKRAQFPCFVVLEALLALPRMQQQAIKGLMNCHTLYRPPGLATSDAGTLLLRDAGTLLHKDAGTQLQAHDCVTFDVVVRLANVALVSSIGTASRLECRKAGQGLVSTQPLLASQTSKAPQLRTSAIRLERCKAGKGCSLRQLGAECV